MSRIHRSPAHSAVAPHPLALALAIATALPFALQAQETGQIGQPDSWVTTEFENSGALGMIQAQHAYARGLSGRGVWVGVADSGVMFDHPEFAGAGKLAVTLSDPLKDGSHCPASTPVSDDSCFSATGDSPQVIYRDIPEGQSEQLLALLDQAGEPPGASHDDHGTGVAAQALARRDGVGMHGVAYAANLASVRLFSHEYKDLAAMAESPEGVEISNTYQPHAWDKAYRDMASAGVRVINNSQDMDALDPNDPDAAEAGRRRANELAARADAARKHGMIQVWSTGNESGKPAGAAATLPADNPEIERLWLAVTNLKDEQTLDESSSICGKAAQWCVSAPGTDLTSASIDPKLSKANAELIRDDAGKVTGIEVKPGELVGGYSEVTGTSYSAPVAAGALALLMERYPYLDNAQVRDVLLTTATDIGEAGVDEVFGWGLIDLAKAVDGPGQLRVNTDVVMNQRAGGTQVWEGEAWDEWRNDIAGPGRLGKRGQGWLRLAGDNTFAGAEVHEGILELTGNNALGGALNVHAGGQLIVDGELVGTPLFSDGGAISVVGEVRNAAAAVVDGGGSLTLSEEARMQVGALQVRNGRARIDGQVIGGLTTVDASGVLEGNGSLGDTRVAGLISPGSEAGEKIGELRVAGDYTHLPGATYRVDLTPEGESDVLAVDGRANLQGGRLALSSTPSIDQLGEQYTVLAAAQGVEGKFAELQAPSPFLALVTRYTPTNASVGLDRGLPLASAAATPNQRAVAAAADTQGNDQAVLRTMLTLTPEGARASFDQLSGEIHASTRSLMIESSRIPREAALDRTRKPVKAQSDDSWAPVHGLWGRADHQHDTLKGSDNTAPAQLDGNVLLAGYDAALGGGWTVGAMVGHAKADAKVPDRQSKARISSHHAGVYAGGQWGPWGLGTGYVRSQQQVKAQRHLAWPGMDETLVSKYDTHADQAFIEGSYRWSNGRATLEPFLQYAYVRQAASRFEEAGGEAALQAASPAQGVHLGTAGLRWQTALGNSDALSLRGMLAYRHASQDLTPTLTGQWSGSGIYGIEGAPLARNATLAGVSLLARPSRNTELEFGYSGAFSKQSRDSTINARFEWKF